MTLQKTLIRWKICGTVRKNSKYKAPFFETLNTTLEDEDKGEGEGEGRGGEGKGGRGGGGGGG